jgi:hypothetical protein
MNNTQIQVRLSEVINFEDAKTWRMNLVPVAM